jgi:hypothetical protein
VAYPSAGDKGTSLNELPNDYLAWLATIQLLPPLDELVAEEAERRQRDERTRLRPAARSAVPVPKREKRKAHRQPKG